MVPPFRRRSRIGGSDRAQTVPRGSTPAALASTQSEPAPGRASDLPRSTPARTASAPAARPSLPDPVYEDPAEQPTEAPGDGPTPA